MNMDVYTLLYLKWITNKKPLYSTWNSAQCYVAALGGGVFRGEWIHEYVWLSAFTFTWNYHNIVDQLHVNKKLKKNHVWHLWAHLPASQALAETKSELLLLKGACAFYFIPVPQPGPFDTWLLPASKLAVFLYNVVGAMSGLLQEWVLDNGGHL